jgi:hypothetical protein
MPYCLPLNKCLSIGFLVVAIQTMTLFIGISYGQETPVRRGANAYDAKSIEENYTPVSVYNDREFTLTSGFDYSSGKFNLPTSTNIIYVPYAIKYKTGPVTFRASSGYINLTGPKNVVTATDGVPLLTNIDLTEPDNRVNRKKNGFGDVYLSATYSFENPFQNDLYFDLTGRIKIPTADEFKGLGTGKVDYIAQADIAYLIGNFMPFGTIGYRFVGKSNLYDLQNSFFASIGMAYYVTHDTSIGASYDYRESSTPNFPNPKEIFGYIDVQINDHWGINFYGVSGLNNTTTDYGLGTQVRYKF